MAYVFIVLRMIVRGIHPGEAKGEFLLVEIRRHVSLPLSQGLPLDRDWEKDTYRVVDVRLKKREKIQFRLIRLNRFASSSGD